MGQGLVDGMGRRGGKVGRGRVEKKKKIKKNKGEHGGVPNGLRCLLFVGVGTI